MISGFPLFGLAQEVEVQLVAPTQTSFGQVRESAAQIIYPKLKCRIIEHQKFTNIDKQYMQGKDITRIIKFLTEYAPKVKFNCLFTLKCDSVVPKGTYRIFYVRNDQDHLGGFHHSVFYGELQ